ncbi:MAG: glycosyltransferase [Anaerolineae bacterium]|nr:glycosyltransferase [Anaerolineae bacterium]
MSERPTRIVYILTRLNIGSPTMHAVLLTRGFCPPHYESVLVCGEDRPQGGDMTYFAEAQGVHPIRVRELGGSLSNLVALVRLYRLIRQLQPDVVHTHQLQAGFVGRLAARLAGVPVIVHTIHAHVFSGQYDPIRTRLFILMERFAASQADIIITLTQSLRYELVERYHIARHGRITILPLGLDLSALAQTQRHSGEFRRRWSLPADAPLIGIVGQITPVKNHALFLHAAALVRAQRPDAHFVIVGDGESRREVEALVDKLNLLPAVTFTGWQRDLAPIYSDMDVVVISSLNEGTPVSVIESLAAGCPVVATAVGGLPDLLDQGNLGMLVKAGDVDELANGILQTLSSPPDVTTAQRLMLDRYGIDRLVKDLDELYRGLLAKKRRSQ